MLSLSLAYNRIFFVQEMKFPYIKDISHTEKMRVKLSSTFFEYEMDISFNTINPESKIMEDTDRDSRYCSKLSCVNCSKVSYIYTTYLYITY